MTTTRRSLQLALDSFAARAAEDPRLSLCELALESTGDGYAVDGTVSTHAIARDLFDFLASFEAIDRGDSTVRVLSDLRTERTITNLAAPVRAAPDEGAEQVTQALYGDAVSAYDREGDWRRITAPDGYLGWVHDSAVEAVRSDPSNSVLTENVATDALDIGADEPVPEFFPTGARCVVTHTGGDSVTVRFRTGVEATVPAGSVSDTEPPHAPEAVVEVARQYLGTDYEWGGMTSNGIDCSGLVWVSYRVLGFELPRDADQQRRVGEAVEREELEPGDLLFFPGHVAIRTGGDGFIHAHGDSGGVVESSLDPADEGYIESLDEGLDCCRRPLP